MIFSLHTIFTLCLRTLTILSMLYLYRKIEREKDFRIVNLPSRTKPTHNHAKKHIAVWIGKYSPLEQLIYASKCSNTWYPSTVYAFNSGYYVFVIHHSHIWIFPCSVRSSQSVCCALSSVRHSTAPALIFVEFVCMRDLDGTQKFQPNTRVKCLCCTIQKAIRTLKNLLPRTGEPVSQCTIYNVPWESTNSNLTEGYCHNAFSLQKWLGRACCISRWNNSTQNTFIYVVYMFFFFGFYSTYLQNIAYIIPDEIYGLLKPNDRIRSNVYRALSSVFEFYRTLRMSIYF